MELVLLTDSYVVISLYDKTTQHAWSFKSHENDPEFAHLEIADHKVFEPQDVSFDQLICATVRQFFAENSFYLCL